MRNLLLIAMLLWALPSLADTATIVNGMRVNLRSGKTDTARVIKSLAPGTVVEVLHLESAYVQVKTAEGDVGWLPLRLLKIHITPPAKAVEPPSDADSTVSALQAQLSQAQTELEQSRGQRAGLPLWVAVSAGCGGLVLGLLLGMGGLQAYYRKRLKGLRI